MLLLAKIFMHRQQLGPGALEQARHCLLRADAGAMIVCRTDRLNESMNKSKKLFLADM